jgi:hypothetical protein
VGTTSYILSSQIKKTSGENACLANRKENKMKSNKSKPVITEDECDRERRRLFENALYEIDVR